MPDQKIKSNIETATVAVAAVLKEIITPTIPELACLQAFEIKSHSSCGNKR
jgi:hypothetical protein